MEEKHLFVSHRKKNTLWEPVRSTGEIMFLGAYIGVVQIPKLSVLD
jgi:hypothetical protein